MDHQCTKHPPGTTSCYAHHRCRCTPCRRQHARDHKAWMLRALRGQVETIDATGTVRRLRALCAIGWSRRELGAILGMEKSAVDRLVTGVEVCWRSTARRVKDAYETHWQGPPEPTTGHEGACRKRTRNVAARQGWASPMDWDEGQMDDPEAHPSITRIGAARPQGATAEDVAWMAETGETLLGIQMRSGLSISGIEYALKRADRDDLWRRIMRREAA